MFYIYLCHKITILLILTMCPSLPHPDLPMFNYPAIFNYILRANYPAKFNYTLIANHTVLSNNISVPNYMPISNSTDTANLL